MYPSITLLAAKAALLADRGDANASVKVGGIGTCGESALVDTGSLVLQTLAQALGHVVKDGTQLSKVSVEHVIARAKRVDLLIPGDGTRNNLGKGNVVVDTAHTHQEH